MRTTPHYISSTGDPENDYLSEIVTCDSKSFHSDRFTPIKICIKNRLYCINSYSINWYNSWFTGGYPKFTAGWYNVTINKPMESVSEEGDIDDETRATINEKLQDILGMDEVAPYE